MQDSTRSIASSAKHFFSGTLISRSTGLAREVAMAAAFGTNPAVAAFLMAFRFSFLLRRLFGEGALHVVFVPHFESLRKQDSKLAARFFYDLSIGVALTLFLITVVIEAILGAVLLWVPVSAGNKEVIELTMLLLPALIFISLYALNTSLLNCEHSFFLPSVAPSVLNLMWILAIFLVWQQPITRAIEYLAMLLVLAFALQWIVTTSKVLRYLSFELGDQWREKRFSGREIAKLLSPFALGMLGVAAGQINSALDGLFARAADPEGPAYLWYALRIQQLPLALFGLGLTGALLPPISRAIQQQDKTQFLHFVNFSLKKAIVLLIPTTAAIGVLGLSSVNLVYGHGAFTDSALMKTTECLWAYGIALVPMTVVLILASAFYAYKNYMIPTWLSVITVVLNLSFNAICIFVFHWGALSVASATTVAASINSLALGLMLKRKYGLSLDGLTVTILKVILASLLASLATLYLGAYYLQDTTLSWLTQAEFNPLPKNVLNQLSTFSLEALCFFGTLLCAVYVLRIQEFLDLIPWTKKIIHKV